MPHYNCVGGLGIEKCGRTFETLQAARIHDEQVHHSVIDHRGKPIEEYPEGEH